MSEGGAFVAGAIVSKILLDNSGFKAAVKEVLDEGLKLSGMSKEMADKFSSAGKIMTGIGGGIVAMFGGMALATAKSRDELMNMSERTGMSVEMLSSLSLAADKADVDLEILARGAGMLSKKFYEVAGGNEKMAAEFEKMGLDPEKFETVDQALFAIADKFKSMPDGIEKTGLAMTLFGGRGRALISLLNQGSEGLRREQEEARRLGHVLTKETGVASQLFEDNLKTLKAEIGAVSKAFITDMIPVMSEFFAKATESVNKIREWVAAHPELNKMIAGTGLVLGGLVMTLGTAGMAIPKIAAGFGFLKVAVGALFSPVGLVTAGVLGLLVAFSPGATISEKFGNALNTIVIVLTKLSKGLKDVGSFSGWFSQPFKMDAAKKMAEAKENVDEFAASLKVLKPTMEEMEKASAGGKDKWEAYKASVSATDKILAANKETLIGWIDKGAKWLGLVDDMGDAGDNLGEVLKKLGAKTKDQLTKELAEATKALADLKSTTQATPGQVKVLEEKIAGLKEAMSGVKVETKSLAEQLGLLLRVDLEKKFDSMISAVGKYKGKLTEAGEKKMMDDLIALRGELDGTVPHIITLTETLDQLFEGIDKGMTDAEVEGWGNQFADMAREMQIDFEESTKGIAKSIMGLDIPIENLEPMLKSVGDALGWSANSVRVAFYNMRVDILRTIGIVLPYIDTIPDKSKTAADKTKSVWQECSSVIADSLKEIARSIVDVFNFKGLFGAVAIDVKFDSSVFDALVDAAESAYDKITGAARESFDAQEKQISRAEEDEDIRYSRAYDRERKAISDSPRAREEKDAMLLALEIAYEDAKLVRERAREDAKYAREEAQKVKLLALEKAHQLELDTIRKDEDTARQKLADDEEKRQNSLWFKVKGIMATACGEMATIFLTTLLKPVGEAIGELAGKLIGKGVGSVGDALDETGNKVGGLGKTIGEFISGIGTGIGGFISGLAAGIGTAIVTLATAIATAATTLAAAAPAIIVVGLIALGLYAGIKLLGSIFSSGGGAGAGDGMGRVVERQDQQTALLTTIKNFCTDNIALGIQWTGKCMDYLWEAKGFLSTIADNTGNIAIAIGNLRGASAGVVSTQTELVMVHGTREDPEIIARRSQLVASTDYSRASGPRQAKESSVNLTFNINALDGADVVQATKRIIIPEIQKFYRRGGQIPASAIGGA